MSTKPIKPEDLEKMSEQLAPAIRMWMESMGSPLYHDHQFAIALERMIKYKAHIRAGFTDAQALELCHK